MVRRHGLVAAIVATIAALATASAALADGDETLGTPSVPIADGTDVVVAGVGTQGHADTPVSFGVAIPAGASVKQVLVYWQGQTTTDSSIVSGIPDATIAVNGNSVAGTLIGGPSNPFLRELFWTYRADITGLGLVSAGANTLTVSDMNFQTEVFGPTGNKGAGVVVIYDDGSTSTVVGVRDGNDYAYAGFPAPYTTTVPQTFSFAPADSARAGSLGILAGEVLDHDFTGVQGNVITGQFDTGQTFTLVNELQSREGDEFDARNFPLTIPAGASALTVQVLSQGGDAPASLLWLTGTLTVDTVDPPPPPPPPAGDDGCTPGYWKNHLDSWPPTGFAPAQALSSVFSPAGLGSLGSKTLRDALKFGGGSSLTAKKQILLRAAVASLLNSGHPDLEFEWTTAEVVAAVNAALASGDKDTIVSLAGDLDDSNNGDCSLS
jgi:hypothetical protein